MKKYPKRTLFKTDELFFSFPFDIIMLPVLLLVHFLLHKSELQQDEEHSVPGLDCIC